MAVFSADDISMSYGARDIFRGASFKVEASDKIGLVGVNGAGKTTLLRILAGQERPDSGTVAKERGLVISYMRQNGDLEFDGTPEQAVLGSFGQLVDMEKRLELMAADLGRDASAVERYNKLRDRFADLGGLTFRSRVRSALLGLGLTENELALRVSDLSGGQRARVLLAVALLSGAGLLLLDEPTNHLDSAAIEWLEDFLLSYRGAVMVVSHDRFFLDRICGRIFELENCRLGIYKGNYSKYREQKEFDLKTLQRDYEAKLSQVRRIEGIIEQQRRFNQARNYVTIKSKQKQIDRIMDTVVKPEAPPSDIHFGFKSAGGCGRDVLICEGLGMAYGSNVLFKNADIYINKGEKVFLVGANGKGKSTLLGIITGRTAPAAGSIRLGAGVKIGYYAQDRCDLDDNKNIFEVISDAYPRMDQTSIRSALGAFLFKGDDVFKPVRELSGGERARVSLARLMLSDTNFLILDEPTNHLDISSKEALEAALRGYDGTVLAVSHDRYFIDRLADRIYFISDGRICSHDGNYSSLYERLKNDSHPPEPEKRPSSAAEDYKRRKQDASEQRKRLRRLEQLEQLIKSSEAQLQSLTDELQSNASDYKKLAEISESMTELKGRIDTLYAEWLELSDS